MRRAILLLAALAAGTSGCSSDNCPNGGTLTVYWQPQRGGFTTAAGQLLGCDAAGVSDLDVSINGQVIASHVPCHGPNADGVQLFGFGDEVVTVQIDAYDASNRHLYQVIIPSQSTVLCADTVVDATLPALTGDLTVGYQFTDSFSCTANTFIWYTLLDVTRNQVVDEVGPSSANPQAIPCGSVITLSALPFGAYTVTRIQEVQFTPPNNYVTFHATCSAQSFDHVTAGETQTVLVPASGGTCF